MSLPHCPQCNSEYTYEDNGMFICLVEGDHNIDCKIDGFGPMKLKSEFVKKN
ncbi:TPA: PhnA domain-containing protein [Citrobacter koseri]